MFLKWIIDCTCYDAIEWCSIVHILGHWVDIGVYVYIGVDKSSKDCKYIVSMNRYEIEHKSGIMNRWYIVQSLGLMSPKQRLHSYWSQWVDNMFYMNPGKWSKINIRYKYRDQWVEDRLYMYMHLKQWFNRIMRNNTVGVHVAFSIKQRLQWLLPCDGRKNKNHNCF